MEVKKEKGFQPDSARRGGYKAMLMHQGFPDHIKNKDAREAHIVKVMKGQRYDGFNEVRFKPPLDEAIKWNPAQKFKRARL
tara:strand:- start:914 stop:1156 length:243 start_codon:yes stop_codon:yes gene_type:complete